MSDGTRVRRWAHVAAAPLAYFAAARLAALWTVDADSAQTFWPAAGIAVGLAVRAPRGHRYLTLATGVTGGTIANDVVLGTSTGDLAIDVAANLVEGLIALTLGLAVLRRNPVPRPTMTASLAVLAILSAAAGAGIAAIGFNPDDPADLFVRWLIGDALGIFAIAPLVLIDWTLPVAIEHRYSRLELRVASAAAIVAAILAFNSEARVAYLTLPFLLWVSVRGGPRYALPVAAALIAIACVATAEESGPFALTSDPTLQVQTFNVAVALSAQLVSTVVTSRQLVLARQRAVLAALPDDAVLTDHRGRTIWYVNRRAQAQPRADSLFAAVAADQREAVAEQVGRTATSSEPISRVWPGARPGEVVEFRSAPVGDDTALTIIRDITEQVANTDALEAAEARWRRMIESSYEGIIEVDGTSTIVYASPRIAEMVQTSPTELIGVHLSEIVGDAWAHRHFERSAARQGTPSTFETTYQTADGDQRWAIVSVSPHDASPSEYNGALIFATDITVLREAENERQELVERLASIEQRQRQEVAQDIHDGPLQDLAAANLLVGQTRRASDDPSGSLLDVEATLSNVIEALRAQITVLDPALIEHGHLMPALVDHARRVLAGSETVVHTVGGSPFSSGTTAMAAYLIAREAITNAARHSDATELTLATMVEDGRATLRVHDDGRGFDPANTPLLGHIGLRSMHQRAVDAGLALTIDSHPASGTTVTLRAADD